MYTRYFFFLFIFSCCFCFNANAQNKNKFGLLLGGNFGGYIGKADTSASGILGVGGQTGLFYQRKFNKVNLETNFYYTYKTVSFTQNIWNEDTLQIIVINFGNDSLGNPVLDSLGIQTTYDAQVKGKIRNHLIEIPIFFEIPISKKTSLLGGTFVSYIWKKNMSGDVDIQLGQFRDITQSEKFDDSKYLKSLDIGLIGGFRYHFSSRLSTDFRITFGFVPLFQKVYSSQKLFAFYNQLNFNYIIGSK